MTLVGFGIRPKALLEAEREVAHEIGTDSVHNLALDDPSVSSSHLC